MKIAVTPLSTAIMILGSGIPWEERGPEAGDRGEGRRDAAAEVERVADARQRPPASVMSERTLLGTVGPVAVPTIGAWPITWVGDRASRRMHGA